LNFSDFQNRSEYREKQIRQQAIIDSQHVDDLQIRWTCQQICPNKTGWCYVVDTVHLKLYPQNLKTWSIAINKDPDVATIDTCPIELAKTLMTAKANLKNPLRDVPELTPSKTAVQNAVSSPITPSHPYGAPFSYYPPYGISPYPQQFPPPLYTQHFPPPTVPTTNATIAVSDEPTSSQPSEIEAVDKLSQYISWLAKNNPTLTEQLAQCYELLKEHDIVYKTITAVSDKIFEEWKISLGIQLLLRSQQKRFEKARDKGRI
jgi:hypothetical protein